MAKHSREYHSCDICGAEMEKPYNGGETGTYRIHMEQDYAVAGNHVRFDELCRQCNDWLGRAISDLIETTKQMRIARTEAKYTK